MKKFEVYEDNGGGIHMAILEENGDAIAIFSGFECGEKGILLDAINQLGEDEDAWKGWDGDTVEAANADGGKPEYDEEYNVVGYEPYTIEEVYNEIEENDDLISEEDFDGICTLYVNKMGAAGGHVFNLPDPSKYNIE